MQCEYHHVFSGNLIYKTTIYCWYKQFKITKSLDDRLSKHSGRPSVVNVWFSDDESVDIRNNFIHHSKKSIHKVFRNTCILLVININYYTTSGNDHKRSDFVLFMNKTENYIQFLHHVIFSNGVTFHVAGHFHDCNVRICAAECLYVFMSIIQLKVWRVLAKVHVLGLFSFSEQSNIL